MEWFIPGTALKAPREDVAHVEQMFRSMFLAGDLTLSQVAGVSGLEPYTIQNWVKRGFLSAPQRKRYNLNQLCRILNINMLKNCLPMEKICGLLSYVNGDLDNTADDLIRDTDLYFIFVNIAARIGKAANPDQRDAIVREYLSHYEELVPGARERVAKVLAIMLTAWASAQLQSLAEHMIEEIM